RGGEIVSRDPIIDTATDFGDLLRLYDRSRPDAVLVVTIYFPGKAFLEAAAAHHLAARIVGGDGWPGELAQNPAAEGVFWPSVYLPSDSQPVAVHFRRAFVARHGHQPDANAALAYDATLAVLEA